MSYESKFNNQTKFIQPAQLTLLISIVLHLLVYKFGLPRLNLNSESGRREVSIVELTPEQQSRLPNLYPESEIPEINNTPLDSAAPPFAFPPSLIPGSEAFPNLPPVTIPPPPNFDIPPIPDFPPISDIQLPPVGDLSSLPLPPPVESLDKKVEQQSTAPLKKTPPTPPKAKQPQENTSPPTTAAKPEPKPESEEKLELSPQEIAAQRQQNLQKKVRSLSSSLQKREAGTTDEAARKNYVAWLSEVKAIEPETLVIEGTYPRDACIRRLEGTSVYGVVADASGMVVALDLIKGAKYPIFNEQASKDLSSRELSNDTGKAKPYQITVEYKYDAEICPSLTLPSLRRDNQSEPEPEPKSQPAPTEAKPETTEIPAEAETKPEPQPKPEAEAETKTQPELAPAEAETKPEAPETRPKPQPESKPELPSLKDRLRDVPLPERKPSQLERTPLPEAPRL